jgi:hypothetical protein
MPNESAENVLPVIATPIYRSTILPLEGFEGKQSPFHIASSLVLLAKTLHFSAVS